MLFPAMELLGAPPAPLRAATAHPEATRSRPGSPRCTGEGGAPRPLGSPPPTSPAARAPCSRPGLRTQPWALLRLLEPAFPPDGFARATRFEEAHHAGRVRDADDLDAFVEGVLREVGAFSLPFVRATRADPAVHAAADAVCEAALLDRAARSASRETGQAFLGSAAGLSPETSLLVAAAHRQRLAGHLAPAFGAVLGALGAADEDACRLFLFLGARGIFSDAVRLGVVGPLEAYARLSSAAATIDGVLSGSASPDPARAAWWTRPRA